MIAFRVILTIIAALEGAVVALTGLATPAYAPAPETTVEAPAGLTVCGQPVEDNEVTRIAADEIFRLDAEGYPVCEANWAFTDTMEKYLGLAYDNDRNFIMMNSNAEHYTTNDKPLDAMVRHVVRHEFGHQVVFQFYPANDPATDAELSYLFTGTENTEEPGHEIAADAIAAALGDDAAAYSSHQINTARTMLGVDTLG